MPTSNAGQTAKKTTVAATVATVTLTSAPTVGVRLYADAGNTVPVFHGFNPAITPGTTDATDGFPVVAGASDFIPPSALAGGLTFYVVASASGQKIYYKAE